MFNIWLAISVFVACYFAFMFLRIKIQEKNDNALWEYQPLQFGEYSDDNPIVSSEYICQDGKFVISGTTNEFVVMKNHELEFLVQNGEITGCRDIKKSGNFVYYGGTPE